MEPAAPVGRDALEPSDHQAVSDLKSDGPGVGRPFDGVDRTWIARPGHAKNRPAPVPQMRNLEILRAGAILHSKLKRRPSVEIIVAPDVYVNVGPEEDPKLSELSDVTAPQSRS